MPNLFTMLPITVVDPALSTIASTDITFLSDFDPTTYDHWIFGASSASLTGLNAGRVLAVQSTAPAYSSTYLTMNNGIGKGLLTAIADTAAATDTICAVVRGTVATGVKVPFGTLDTSTGGSPFFSGTVPARGTFLTYRGAGYTSQNTSQNVEEGVNWYFVGVSRDFSGSSKITHTLVGGGAGYSGSTSGTYLPRVGGLLACGNPYSSAANPSNMDFAEFMVFDRTLTLAQLMAVYITAKARQAARGITVV